MELPLGTLVYLQTDLRMDVATFHRYRTCVITEVQCVKPAAIRSRPGFVDQAGYYKYALRVTDEASTRDRFDANTWSTIEADHDDLAYTPNGPKLNTGWAMGSVAYLRKPAVTYNKYTSEQYHLPFGCKVWIVEGRSRLSALPTIQGWEHARFTVEAFKPQQFLTEIDYEEFVSPNDFVVMH